VVTAGLAASNKHPAALMTRQIGGRLFKREGTEENLGLNALMP
jgi:hypothetical protein